MYLFKVLFILLCNPYSLFGSQALYRQLFFPVVGDSQFKIDDDGLLDELRVSVEQTNGKTRDLYLDAQVAAIYEKRNKAEKLSIQAYEQYLLSKPNGSSIKMDGTIARVLWQLLSGSCLNKETTVLVQELLEQETISGQGTDNFSGLSFHLMKLQRIVQNCEKISLDHSSNQCFVQLKKLVNQKAEQLEKIEKKFVEEKAELKALCEKGKEAVFLENLQQEDFLFKEFNKEKIALKFADLLKKDLLDLKKIKNCKSLSSYFFLLKDTKKLQLHLLYKNSNKFLTDHDIEKRTIVSLRKLDNQELFTKIAQVIKNKENCSIELSTHTVIKVGLLNEEESSTLDLQAIETSSLNEGMSQIIISVGFSNSGDLIEIVKFSAENKIFYKIEIIDRKNNEINSSVQSGEAVGYALSSVSTKLASKPKIALDQEDDLEQSKRF